MSDVWHFLRTVYQILITFIGKVVRTECPTEHPLFMRRWQFCIKKDGVILYEGFLNMEVFDYKNFPCMTKKTKIKSTWQMSRLSRLFNNRGHSQNQSQRLTVGDLVGLGAIRNYLNLENKCIWSDTDIRRTCERRSWVVLTEEQRMAHHHVFFSWGRATIL